MKLTQNNTLFFFLTICLVLTLSACKQKEEQFHNDFSEILASDTLRVVTLNTSTSYFIYREQEMGYHYDMVKNFAELHGLIVKVIVAKNNNELLEKLYNNEGDIIAFNMPIQNELKNALTFCGLSEVTHQVLVQKSEPGDTLIKDVVDLIGRDIYVVEESKYENRIKNLNEELGGGINLKYLNKDTVIVEDLIRMVSTDSIKYTVAEENVARMNRIYFRNLDVELKVSFDQRTSWAVRKESTVLADSLNAWFSRTYKESEQIQYAKRYFEESKGYNRPVYPHKVTLLAPGQISPWDDYFKEYGRKYNLDWRLIAAIAFHESTFNPEGRSWAGAGGLMGIMPRTARSMGVNSVELFIPETNVMLGSQYLRKLIDIFDSVEDENERIKLALASYNGGIGHISDARALAEKYNANKNVWDGNVERYLQLKRLEQYYNDPVCKTGYFRADETINYVRNVMARWQEYKKQV